MGTAHGGRCVQRMEDGGDGIKDKLLFLHHPVRNILLRARKIDADLDYLAVVHLEASGVVFYVDLVEGGLCVLVYFEFKKIDVLLVDEYAVGAAF